MGQRIVAKQQKSTHDLFKEPGVRIIIGLTLIVIVILIAILLYLLAKPQLIEEPRIRIDNFSEFLPNVPEVTHRRIEEELYSYVSNAMQPNEEIPSSGALIREGTINGFDILDSFHVGDFIVDIDSVQQSYIAEYHYGRLDGMEETEYEASVSMFCIEDPELIKYPSFKCEANRDFTKPNAIQYVLPKVFDGFIANYTYSIASVSGYAIVLEFNPSESVYKSGKVEAYKAEKTKELKEYLQKMGLDPDDYEYIEKFRIVR